VADVDRTRAYLVDPIEVPVESLFDLLRTVESSRDLRVPEDIDILRGQNRPDLSNQCSPPLLLNARDRRLLVNKL
jgi:hypothetical protein